MAAINLACTIYWLQFILSIMEVISSVECLCCLQNMNVKSILCFKLVYTLPICTKEMIRTLYSVLLLPMHLWHQSTTDLFSGYFYAPHCVLIVRSGVTNGEGDESSSPVSSCSVAVATRRRRRLRCNRMERKMEESTVRDVETGV